MDGQRAGRRVLIADADPNVRQALWLLCEQGLGMYPVGEASQAGQLRHLQAEVRPDLVLLEWGLPGAEPLELITEMQVGNRTQVIVFGSTAQFAHAALGAGATAYINKCDSPETLLNVLRAYLGTDR